MSLEDFITAVESSRRELVVVNADQDDDRVAELRAYLDRYNFSVSTTFHDEALPDAFLLLTDGEECLAAIDVDTFYEYLIEPLKSDTFAHWSADDPRLSSAVRAFLTNLDENVYRVEQEAKLPLVGISRAIEQRAGRGDAGTVHTGVQQLSRLRDERKTWDTYLRLADRDVDVNLYGVPDWRPPTTDGMTAFGDDDGDHVGDFWFVIYDPDGQDAGGALLAREVEHETYDGFWTFRPDLVSDLTAHVETELQPRLTRLG